MHEHAVTSRGRERYRQDELRVVSDPEAVREVRPAPVEDELALAVRLRVRGRGRDEVLAGRALLVQREMLGDPAGRLTDALGLLEAVEPRVLEERRAALAKERIPGLPRDVLDAGYDAEAEALGQATSFLTSVKYSFMGLPLCARPIATWVDTLCMKSIMRP